MYDSTEVVTLFLAFICHLDNHVEASPLPLNKKMTVRQPICTIGWYDSTEYSFEIAVSLSSVRGWRARSLCCFVKAWRTIAKATTTWIMRQVSCNEKILGISWLAKTVLDQLSGFCEILKEFTLRYIGLKDHHLIAVFAKHIARGLWPLILG